MLDRYTNTTDGERRHAVASASRLTRVGTKTGKKGISLKPSERRATLKWVEAGKLDWRPTCQTVQTLTLLGRFPSVLRMGGQGDAVLPFPDTPTGVDFSPEERKRIKDK